jgi:PPOX class probable F420-dependent enzyme
MDTPESSTLDTMVRAMAKERNHAALTTLMPDGTPQTQVVWIDTDDKCLIVNTEVERQKARNLRRDPRATVLIWQHDFPDIFVEVRGLVVEEIRGSAARANIDDICIRYYGEPYPEANIASERVMFRISPVRQIIRGRDVWQARRGRAYPVG